MLPLSWNQAALGQVPTCSCPHPPLLHMSTCPFPLSLPSLSSAHMPSALGTRTERAWKSELSLHFKWSLKCQFEGCTFFLNILGRVLCWLPRSEDSGY